MKKLLIVTGDAFDNTAAGPSDITFGNLGVWFNDGKLTADKAGTGVDIYNMQLGVQRDSTSGDYYGGVHLINEIDLKSLKVNIGNPKNATKFSATVTIVAPGRNGTASILLAKKGTVRHERSNYTASVPVYDTDTATEIAEKLTASINNRTHVLGLAATQAGAVITITANDTIDWEVQPADDLFRTSTSVTVNSIGYVGFGNYKYLEHLYRETRGDNGQVELYADGPSTFKRDVLMLSNNLDALWRIYNFRFRNPRRRGTHDENIWQYVHVAILNTATTTIAAFDALLTTLGVIESTDVPQVAPSSLTLNVGNLLSDELEVPSLEDAILGDSLGTTEEEDEIDKIVEEVTK